MLKVLIVDDQVGKSRVAGYEEPRPLLTGALELLVG